MLYCSPFLQSVTGAAASQEPPSCELTTALACTVHCSTCEGCVHISFYWETCLAVPDLPTAPRSCCSTDSDTGPMNKWNRAALVSLQGDLKMNVIMKNGLNNKLQKAAGGFMNREEALAVESKPSNVKQMGELIQNLRR